MKKNIDRRGFLKAAGLGIAAGSIGLATGCRTKGTSATSCNAAEDDCCKEQEGDNYSICGKDCRQELNLCHPSQPCMYRSGEVKKQQGDSDEEYRCKRDSDFS